MAENIENLVLEHLKRFQAGQERTERKLDEHTQRLGRIEITLARLARTPGEVRIMRNYSYQIDPRPLDLGGGWRLRLLEDGTEVGGGVFPLAAYLSPFPATDETNEREMAEKAAYEDALAEASAWLATTSA